MKLAGVSLWGPGDKAQLTADGPETGDHIRRRRRQFVVASKSSIASKSKDMRPK